MGCDHPAMYRLEIKKIKYGKRILLTEPRFCSSKAIQIKQEPFNWRD